MTVSREVSGLARQLIEMKEKRRCSILFHLLVAGGECATVMVSCSSLARGCRAFFHSLLRTPLLPPPSALLSSSDAWGYSPLPQRFHHPPMLSTANCAVSCSIPTC